MKKIRETKQKQILDLEINKISSFFTAEDLLGRIKKNTKEKNRKSIGIATVYRFLKELKKNRKIHSYICARKTIYSRNKSSHCHFICEKCGKVEHIKVDSLDFINKKINGSICHFQIDVQGVCKDCKV